MNYSECAEILPVGAELYHYSKSLGELVAAGRFDAAESAYRDGAMFLTPVPVIGTNCSLMAREELVLLDYSKLSVEALVDLYDRELVDSSQSVLVEAGFDGFTRRFFNSLTLLPEGGFCKEIKIFGGSLAKLAEFRRYEAATC